MDSILFVVLLVAGFAVAYALKRKFVRSRHPQTALWVVGISGTFLVGLAVIFWSPPWSILMFGVVAWSAYHRYQEYCLAKAKTV